MDFNMDFDMDFDMDFNMDSNMASAAPAPKRWATQDEWLGHRLTIKRLYKDEDKTLNDVMAIMKHEHGFVATKKMYNTRLKAWGITKNFKAAEVFAILQTKKTRAAAGKASYMAIRNESVDQTRLETYLRRNKTVLGRLEAGEAGPVLLSAPDLVCRTPSPSPAPAPEGPAHQVEELLHLMRSHMDGSFNAGAWFLKDGYCYSRSSKEGDDLLNQVFSRFMDLNIRGKQSSVDVFNTLNPAFAKLEPILRHQLPRATTILIRLAIILYSRRQRDIADMLTRYLTDMTQRVLGASHPLHGIWKRLAALLDPGDRDVEALEQALMLTVNVAKEHSGGSGPFIETLYLDYLDVYERLHERDDTVAELRRQLSRFEGQAVDDSPGEPFKATLWLQYYDMQVEHCCRGGHYEAAVLECEAGAPMIQQLYPWWKSDVLGWVIWEQGQLGKAAENFKRALHIQLRYGSTLSVSAQLVTLSNLEQVLLESGKLEEAAQVSRQYFDLLDGKPYVLALQDEDLVLSSGDEESDLESEDDLLTTL